MVLIPLFPLLKKWSKISYSTFKKSGAKYRISLFPLLKKVEQNIIFQFKKSGEKCT